MTEPGIDQTRTATIPVSNAPVVLRIMLAVVLAIPGVAGLVVLGGVTGEWLSNGMKFDGSDVWLLPVFIDGAEGFIAFSVLTIGIVLRFARWKRARTASLVLAILSVVAIVIGYQLLLDSIPDVDQEDRQLALIFSIAGLIVIALPPLLHWWAPKKPTGKPAN